MRWERTGAWAQAMVLGLSIGCSVRSGENGTNGTSVKVEALQVGDSDCPNGGTRFRTAQGVSFACSGSPGPKGDKGERGDPSPRQNRQQLTFLKSTPLAPSPSAPTSTVLDGSHLTASTSGGDLLIFMDIEVQLTSGWVHCVPLIDGKWAGTYGGLPFVTFLAPFEGMLDVSGVGRWEKTRLYPAIPAGNHDLSISCDMVGTGTALFCGGICSWGFVEIGG